VPGILKSLTVTPIAGILSAAQIAIQVWALVLMFKVSENKENTL
jgi:hypothetical protein